MKYVTWFLSLIVVVIAVVVGSVLIRNIMDDVKTTNTVNTSKSITEQLKENTTLRLYIDGPVIADENHQSMQIDVTPKNRTISLYKTYNNTVFKKTVYENNQKAFEAFALALDKAGFTKSSQSQKDAKYAGDCALGRVYHLILLNGEKVAQDLWSTSCGTTKTFNGSMSAVLNLFKKQIPNYIEATVGSTVSR